MKFPRLCEMESRESFSGHVEGSVVRIKLENVLTYDSVEFACGPRLNVIIGPNGTGKSTIVCAMCLGLAGKPGLIGRAKNPSDFIKYGKDKAKIEIELHNPDGDNWIVCRDIHKDNKSTWHVNRRPATLKSVEELVARLCIQIGNLTQFLPQEKVADFAKMTEIELLENTEKSVGDAELYERHQSLKESRNVAKTLELAHQQLNERLEQEVQKNNRIKQDVENFKEREVFLQKVKSLKMKRSWVEYDGKRAEYMAAKEEKQSLENEYKQARAKNAPIQKQIDDAKANVTRIDNIIKNTTIELKEAARRAESKNKEVDNLTDKFQEIQDDFKLKKDQEDNRKKRLRDLHKQLSALENDLKNTEDTQNVQPQIEAVTRNIQDVTKQLGNLHREGDGLRNQVDNLNRTIAGKQRELKVLSDIENQKLEILRTKHKDTYDAVMWLRQNKDMFSGTIFEPVMLCVNMKDQKYARYLENHVSFNDMRAFVCESSEDMNLFMDKMRVEQKLRVNAVKVPRVAPDRCLSRHPINIYSQFGFQCYLQDTFTCPEPVMKFLCVQYNVQNIPIGDRRTKDLVQTIVEKCPEMRCFFAFENQYNMKRSRYSGQTSSRNTKLKEPSLLTKSVDEAREQEIKLQLRREMEAKTKQENEYNVLQHKSQELDRRLEELRNEKKTLMTKKDLKKRLVHQIETKKQTIRNVESEAINLEAEEAKVTRKVEDMNKKKHSLLMQYSESTQKCVETSQLKVRLSLRQAQAVRSQAKLEADLREQSQNLQQLESAFNRSKDRLKTYKDAAQQALDQARKATNTGRNEEISDQVRKAFESLPNTLEEIESAIHDHQVRADVIVQTNEGVVEEFNKRKLEIGEIEKAKDDKEKEIQTHQQLIEDAKRLWMQPLQDLLGRINQSFSYFFRCLNCVGEVDLRIPDNEDDYSKYGIRIRVKFRDNEQLKELSAHHQSGGERSVTTVLYMMALQELTKCPFRCVDEINQGMDPVNERKVFELVVKTVCQKSSSQYFLLTPKLLPDLEYASNMTVLCVYNGPPMMNHTEWNLTKFLNIREHFDD